MTDSASPALAGFTGPKEGMVTKAYRDPGGVITIGRGFTSMSAVFDRLWKQKTGHSLKMGDTISVAESDQILTVLLQTEYSPPVLKRFGPGLTQPQFDACTDVCYNAGPGALKDKWAASLSAGNVLDAGNKLKSDRITAGGKTLKGLISRRAAEALLLLNGDYGTGVKSLDYVMTYQKDLQSLGYYDGAVDGGVASSDAAVRKFQTDKGLVVDGDVGPATMSAIVVALENKTATKAAGTVVVGGGAVDAGQSAINAPATIPGEPSSMPDVTPTITPAHVDWSIITHFLITGAIIAVVAGALYLAWRYRGVIFKKRTPVT